MRQKSNRYAILSNIWLLRGHEYIISEILAHKYAIITWVIIVFDKFEMSNSKAANLGHCDMDKGFKFKKDR